MKLQAALKYLLSYRKRDWELADYPIRYRFQGRPAGTAPAAAAWLAQISGWEQLPGLGQTKAAAYADLEERFQRIKHTGKPLPRPGTRVPIQIAPHDKVDRYAVIAHDFFAEILAMDYTQVLITDGSSLHDFLLDDVAAIYAKIHAVYGVDVSDISNGNLAAIFARLHQAGAGA